MQQNKIIEKMLLSNTEPSIVRDVNKESRLLLEESARDLIQLKQTFNSFLKSDTPLLKPGIKIEVQNHPQTFKVNCLH
jgi:hypothetical protein